jgi:hypothetical protein
MDPDIKSDNIFLSDFKGLSPVVKLGDLGLGTSPVFSYTRSEAKDL